MGVGNITLSDKTSSGADSLAQVGDNSYIVDSSTQLDFGGANIDTSTKVSMGLQGNEVQSLANMMSNAIGAVSEVANQSARVATSVANKSGGSDIMGFIKDNATYIAIGAIALIAFLNIDKFKRIVK